MRVIPALVVIAVACAPIVHADPRPAGVVCDTLRKYPGMAPVDVALMFSEDQPIYPNYTAAKAAVDREVMSECPELATRGR